MKIAEEKKQLKINPPSEKAPNKSAPKIKKVRKKFAAPIK